MKRFVIALLLTTSTVNAGITPVAYDNQVMHQGECITIPLEIEPEQLQTVVDKATEKATIGTLEFVAGTIGVCAAFACGVPGFALLGGIVIRQGWIDSDDAKTINLTE